VRHILNVSRKSWLTPDTFEISFHRPAGFDFLPGQKMRFEAQGFSRDYTLINAPQDPELTILVRHVPEGRFSPRLAGAEQGHRFEIQGPLGYFGFHPSSSPTVWVATGTGIAPFIAFVRAGLRSRLLLHGVRSSGERYYRVELIRGTQHYVGCISGPAAPADCFHGRVTDYLSRHLEAGRYDFYLCGRMEMITAAVGIIDQRFDGAHVFSEPFF
jgi:benzoate/toluate 1,2-dioxygenase reductase component